MISLLIYTFIIVILKMTKIDINLDTKIVEFIKMQGTIQYSDLIDQFTIKESKEFRRTKATIDKRLFKLREQNKISRIKGNSKLGHDISDKDGRTSFYSIAERKELEEHIKAVVKELRSKDDLIFREALNELKNYNNYFLTPNELNILSSQVDNMTAEVVQEILYLLLRHHSKKGILPKNIEQFSQNLISAFQLFSKIHEKGVIPQDLRKLILHFLGILESEKIIECIKQDMRSGRTSERILLDYRDKQVAKIIEGHNTELFQYMAKLNPETKKAEREFLAKIRAQARKTIYPETDQIGDVQ